MARKIVITSGKGGVGKTTVCCNLAIQLARRGLRTVVCDFDFGLNNADVTLGMEGLAAYDLIDAIEGKCRIRQALVQHPRYPALYILSSNRIPEQHISAQAVKLILELIAPQFDFLLIDCPAGIGEGVHRALACAEEALLVTVPSIPAMRDADRLNGVLQNYRLPVSLVVNRARRELSRREDVLSPQEIARTLRLPLCAVIYEDDRLSGGSAIERSRCFRVLTDALACPKQQERRGIFATWGRK